MQYQQKKALSLGMQLGIFFCVYANTVWFPNDAAFITWHGHESMTVSLRSRTFKYSEE